LLPFASSLPDLSPFDFTRLRSYSPRMIITPAATATPAMIVPIPEELKCRRCAKPVTMSQTANNSTPILLFIAETPFK
jgi:hypothetical protein